MFNTGFKISNQLLENESFSVSINVVFYDLIGQTNFMKQSQSLYSGRFTLKNDENDEI